MSVGDVDDSVVQLPQWILARLVTAQVEAVVDGLIGLSVLGHYAGTYNIHQHTYIRIHTYIHTYINTYIHQHTYTHQHKYTHAYIDTYINKYI